MTDAVTVSDDEVIEALVTARNQIVYLHGRFQETGSGNGVIAQLDDLRHKIQAAASPTSPTEVKALESEVDRIWAQLTKFVYARGEVAVGRSAYNDEKSAKDIIRSALQGVRDER